LSEDNDSLRGNHSKFRDENNNLLQENSQLRDRNTVLDVINIQLNEENARLRRENLSLGNTGGLTDAGEARQADGPPSPRDPAGPPL
jgi:hypothetical protein